MKWITRERPKIDRLACPWLIKKFVYKEAEFIYVPFNQVIIKAKELSAIPFDNPDVEFTHYNDHCTFDHIVKKHKIKDPAIVIIASIVRGADNDRHDIAKEAAGLWAISAGLAHNITDDYELLKTGMIIYDALYSWASHLHKQKHLQNSLFENLLHEVYNKFLKVKEFGKKKIPEWVKELKGIIQDQIDTQFTFDLKKISTDLELNPFYLSRGFSKYFQDLNFGEYTRKIRIEKAIALIQNSKRFSYRNSLPHRLFRPKSFYKNIQTAHREKTTHPLGKPCRKVNQIQKVNSILFYEQLIHLVCILKCKYG